MKKLLSVILALTMCLSMFAFTASAETSDNLLVNPSFEDGMNGWVAPDGKWSTVESESGYEPRDGSYFAWPSEAYQENTYIYQDVSLNGRNAGESIIFSLMVCNYDQSPHDMGKVELQFLDASGNQIKTYSQEQRNPDWHNQVIIATIPAGAVTARVVLWAIWYVGGDVDAYYDMASVVATTEKYNMVYITEKDGKEDAKAGDILTLTADNGVSQNPLDYEWSSSYNEAATVDANGIVTMITDGSDGFAIYAKDKKTGVVGVYWINSENENLKPASGSDWASAELAQADALGLIPDVLVDADLTQDITRAEFAAVAVKVYEALSGTAAIPVINNPFTDTSDIEVLKAYNIGAVNGTSATTYDPDALLNREQAATMLTRVFKKVSLAGWTLATDSQFTLPYEKPALFADDADISDWAKDSVYFMVANGIINGVGNNKFAPKNVTSADEANGYANATREQALIIAVRMVENLKK
ncbi:MAG: S-layer homology domain-containing protein [Clostridia bacterium]|nr:S-layer homology domain-containing protein [Clostridia bacterium]